MQKFMDLGTVLCLAMLESEAKGKISSTNLVFI